MRSYLEMATQNMGYYAILSEYSEQSPIPLERAIAKGRFREDLRYRLNVISIDVPSSREPKQDLISMAEFLIRKN